MFSFNSVKSKLSLILWRGCSGDIWEKPAFDIIKINRLKTSLSYDGVISALHSKTISSKRPSLTLSRHDLKWCLLATSILSPLISCSSESLSLFGTIISIHLLICYILIPLLECKLHEGGDSVLFPSVSSLLGLCLPHHWDSDSVTTMTEAVFLGLLKGGHGRRQIGEYFTCLIMSSFFKNLILSLPYHKCSCFTDENLRLRMIA